MPCPPEYTLAFLVSTGWRVGVYCNGCGPRATLESPDIVKQFGDRLLSTVGEVCSRLRCSSCGTLGGWMATVAGVSPELICPAANVWQSRDLYLRRLLVEAGLDVGIADGVWDVVEAANRGHPSWVGRAI